MSIVWIVICGNEKHILVSVISSSALHSFTISSLHSLQLVFSSWDSINRNRFVINYFFFIRNSNQNFKLYNNIFSQIKSKYRSTDGSWFYWMIIIDYCLAVSIDAAVWIYACTGNYFVFNCVSNFYMYMGVNK